MRIPAGAVLSALAFLALSSPARADERHFTYSYEPRTLPKGSWELEQSATLRTGRDEGTLTALDLREEVEYGITDLLTTALYLNFRYQKFDGIPGRLDTAEFEFTGVSSEWKYKLSDPSADVVGLLAYAELELAEDEMELELKAVVGKDVGDFHLVYNLVFEIEWLRSQTASATAIETHYDNRYFVNHTFGVSWQPVVWGAVGAEAVIENRFSDDLTNRDFTAMFVGPNIHIAQSAWWATLTVLVQADVFAGGRELDLREKLQVRLLFGVGF